jgi:type IV pilus assembly protein PilC
MITFTYTARSPLGKLIQGELEAASRDEVAQKLRRDGLQVLAVEDVDGDGDLIPRRIRKSDIIYLTNQLAVMVDTGIMLSAALDGIARQEEHSALRAMLIDLKDHVESGEDFSAALARYPKHFDKTYVAMIRASEQTGKMGEMLTEIAAYLRKELDTRNKVRAALAYPAVMAVVATGVTVFLLTYILPKFEPLFKKKGVKLPGPTIAVMNISEVLINYWYFWLALVVGLLATYLFGRRTVRGRQILDWCKINMPVLGVVFRKVNISRSIRTLGTMVGSGVAMLEAIQLTADVSGNYYYEQSWRRVQEDIKRGNQICDVLRTNPLFPRTLVQMIGAGEETGRLADVLERVSDYYDREVEHAIKAATSLIEPAMIVAMGVVVGGIGMSLLLPIFSLSRAV